MHCTLNRRLREITKEKSTWSWTRLHPLSSACYRDETLLYGVSRSETKDGQWLTFLTMRLSSLSSIESAWFLVYLPKIGLKCLIKVLQAISSGEPCVGQWKFKRFFFSPFPYSLYVVLGLFFSHRFGCTLCTIALGRMTWRHKTLSDVSLAAVFLLQITSKIMGHFDDGPKKIVFEIIQARVYIFDAVPEFKKFDFTVYAFSYSFKYSLLWEFFL